MSILEDPDNWKVVIVVANNEYFKDQEEYEFYATVVEKKVKATHATFASVTQEGNSFMNVRKGGFRNMARPARTVTHAAKKDVHTLLDIYFTEPDEIIGIDLPQTYFFKINIYCNEHDAMGHTFKVDWREHNFALESKPTDEPLIYVMKHKMDDTNLVINAQKSSPSSHYMITDISYATATSTVAERCLKPEF